MYIPLPAVYGYIGCFHIFHFTSIRQSAASTLHFNPHEWLLIFLQNCRRVRKFQHPERRPCLYQSASQHRLETLQAAQGEGRRFQPHVGWKLFRMFLSAHPKLGEIREMRKWFLEVERLSVIQALVISCVSTHPTSYHRRAGIHVLNSYIMLYTCFLHFAISSVES